MVSKGRKNREENPLNNAVKIHRKEKGDSERIKSWKGGKKMRVCCEIGRTE